MAFTICVASLYLYIAMAFSNAIAKQSGWWTIYFAPSPPSLGLGVYPAHRRPLEKKEPKGNKQQGTRNIAPI